MKHWFVFLTWINWLSVYGLDIPPEALKRPVRFVQQDSLQLEYLKKLRNSVLVPTAFSSSTLLSIPDLSYYPNDSLAEIWVIYTDYSEVKGFNQGSLNKNRIRNLYDSLPWLSKNKNIKWRDMFCRNIKDRATASSCYHGFLFVYKNQSNYSYAPTTGRSIIEADSIILVVDVSMSMGERIDYALEWLNRKISIEKIKQIIHVPNRESLDEGFNYKMGCVYSQFPSTNGERFKWIKKAGSADTLYPLKGVLDFDQYSNLYNIEIMNRMPKSKIDGYVSLSESSLSNLDPSSIYHGVLEAQKNADDQTAILVVCDNVRTWDLALIGYVTHPVNVLLAHPICNRVSESLVNLAYQTGGSMYDLGGLVIDFRRRPLTGDGTKSFIIRQSIYDIYGKYLKEAW